MTILVTGAKGFIAKNLLAVLERDSQNQLLRADRGTSAEELAAMLKKADVVVHLAGENRPTDPDAFKKVNTDLSAYILETLEKNGRPYKLLYASSTQAALDNEYGRSKKEAEEILKKGVKNGNAVIFRFPGVFGKWCRPNYNSVVATYCHNVANNLPIEVRDREYKLTLMYVDDVVKTLTDHIQAPATSERVITADIEPVYEITLGKLADSIQSFKDNRNTFFLPQVGDAIQKKLYSTYLTYLPKNAFDYAPVLRTDERGSLFELLKTNAAGQIFVSSTKPGITRGNHFHHTKTEKFCVVYGKGLIQFRKIGTDEVIEYKVEGEDPRIVDIPPGYTHNIKNTGETDMITLFWANEIFDPQNPDTYFEKV